MSGAQYWARFKPGAAAGAHGSRFQHRVVPGGANRAMIPDRALRETRPRPVGPRGFKTREGETLPARVRSCQPCHTVAGCLERADIREAVRPPAYHDDPLAVAHLQLQGNKGKSEHGTEGAVVKLEMPPPLAAGCIWPKAIRVGDKKQLNWF